MIEQLSLFQASYELFKLTKPIRLIELFAGIGAQAKALENLGVPFESHRVVEWSCKSIIAYNAIHKQDWNDYSQGLSLDELINRVRGVSMDYSQPMTDKQLRQKGERWLRRLYSSMIAIKDYCPDVSKVTGEDLAIERESVRTITCSRTHSLAKT